MKSLTTDRFRPTLSKQHEARIQALRHERESESRHLDGLKKALHSKLNDTTEDKLRVA